MIDLPSKEEVKKEIAEIESYRASVHATHCCTGDEQYQEKSIRLRYLKALLNKLNADA